MTTRPTPDDPGYSVYDYGHLDFPDEYTKAPCAMVVHVDDVDNHDTADPCEMCSPEAV